jgi:hypothetical protein
MSHRTTLRAWSAALALLVGLLVFGTAASYAEEVGRDKPGGDQPESEQTIKLEKYVSDDGQDEQSWKKADYPSEAVKIRKGDPVFWKIEVMNEGEEPVSLNLVDLLQGNALDLAVCKDQDDQSPPSPLTLAPDQQYVCVIEGGPAVPGLVGNQVVAQMTDAVDAAGKGKKEGDWAYYVGIGEGNGLDGDKDDDDQVEIEVKKSVSANGQDWYDADSPYSALKISVADPDPVVYWKIEVENEGKVTVNLAYEDWYYPDPDGAPLGGFLAPCLPGSGQLPIPVQGSLLYTLGPDTGDPADPPHSATCVIGPVPASPGLHYNWILVKATAVDPAVEETDKSVDRAYYIGIDGAVDAMEGCSLGYWKNHTGMWQGYKPGEDYETVFGVQFGADPLFTLTLLQALQQGGGGEAALGRQAVAALLNAAHSGVNFTDGEGEPITELQVIALVQDAYVSGEFGPVKDLLEAWNERYCPLVGPADPQGGEQPGTRTRAHWRQHPEEWPHHAVKFGGNHYEKAAAIALMGAADNVAAAAVDDMTYLLFSSAVAGELNVAIGNDPSCIADTLTAADDWLMVNAVGSGVASSDAAWQQGAALFETLESYNAGALCAPASGAAGSSVYLPLLNSN